MKVSLTDICDFQGGTQPPKDEWLDQPTQGYVRMLQIRDFTQSDKNYIEYVKDTGKLKTCIEDDILIGRYGASIGKILTGLAGAYNVAIVKTIPDEKVVSKKYLYWYLNSQYFQRFISNVGSRAAQAGFNKNDLGAAQIPLVDKERQEEICDVLEKANKLISLRKQQLAKLDELVKARFVEMFGKASLLAQNQAKRLEECCISILGGNTPSMQHPEYYGGNIPFVKSGDVKGDYIVESTLTLTKTALTETTAKILPKSTLIVVIRSAALLKEFRIGMLMVDAVINQDLKALQVSEDFLPVYLMWAIKMQHQVLLNKVQTMLTSHIRMEDLLNLKIGTPPLSLQNQFAAFVERVDQQKQTVQQSLEKLELMKKALMQEYFG